MLVQAAEPLPSWNDGPSKKNIIEFVQAVTDQSSKDFVKPEDRIAVFDNDGTLWSEQPMYFELLFALDEVKRTAPQHPEWKTTQPFKAVLENDHKALAASRRGAADENLRRDPHRHDHRSLRRLRQDLAAARPAIRKPASLTPR